MNRLDPDAWLRRSKGLDTDDLAWGDVRRHALSPEVVRVLGYMQDIESHTVVYLRSLLSTRAIDDPEIAVFLACWLYEETFHGRALARFLAEAGHAVRPRARSGAGLGERVESALTAIVSRAWPDFVAVHMTWGAINELTTLTGYRRLAERARHPVLTQLIARIVRDESRHFLFYFQQAARRLARPGAARITRLLVDRLWAPVGSGVQPAEETRFVARTLFSGIEGRAAARKIDASLRRLPGFGDARLLEGWLDRALGRAAAAAAA